MSATTLGNTFRNLGRVFQTGYRNHVAVKSKVPGVQQAEPSERRVQQKQHRRLDAWIEK